MESRQILRRLRVFAAAACVAAVAAPAAAADGGSRTADALIPAIRACSANATCSPVLARLLTACFGDTACKQAAAQFFTAHPDVLAALDSAFPALSLKVRFTDVIVTS